MHHDLGYDPVVTKHPLVGPSQPSRPLPDTESSTGTQPDFETMWMRSPMLRRRLGGDLGKGMQEREAEKPDG
jgi:hypothetical protein